MAEYIASSGLGGCRFPPQQLRDSGFGRHIHARTSCYSPALGLLKACNHCDFCVLFTCLWRVIDMFFTHETQLKPLINCQKLHQRSYLSCPRKRNNGFALDCTHHHFVWRAATGQPGAVFFRAATGQPGAGIHPKSVLLFGAEKGRRCFYRH